MEREKKSIEGGTFSFKYIFPSDLRELHVNGAYGGLGPDGTIRMAVYSERGAIPNFEKRIITSDKPLGEAIEIEKKYDIVRIIQASFVFNIGTAKSFVEWLNDRIKEHEQFKDEISKRQMKQGDE